MAGLLVVPTAAPQLEAFTPKGTPDQLDRLAFQSPELRVPEIPVDAATIRDQVAAIAAMDAFRATHGAAWRFVLDLRRGVPTLVTGGAIPMVPGPANGLRWSEVAPGCDGLDCLPQATVEARARALLAANQAIFGVADGDLVLDPDGTLAVGRSLYFVRFAWRHAGIPVEGASVYLRINNGNLIQIATSGIGPIALDPAPAIPGDQAWRKVLDYLGPFASPADRPLDDPGLLIVPATPAGQDADAFDGVPGSGISYRLAWRFRFERPGVLGRWEALVDAHDGTLLRFVDTNRYGRVHGGAYPGDNHTGEADRPLPFADTGLPSPDNYADAGGLFPGDSATTTLTGKYTWIDDSCGSISGGTADGDLDLSMGPGTDCDVPDPNPGGAGNTHAARTQYYHLTNINIKARSYLTGNSWLNTSHMNVNVNQFPYCNASSGGGSLNFYRSASGCWNLGEIPGVALHEWGHSMDDFDGSGGQSPPVETRADWTAILQTHDSCVGRGSFTDGNCGGYGDSCVSCDGIRDADYAQHAHGVPWTAANYGSVWSCGGIPSYTGPCGWEDHCESGFASQAIWDLVVRDLTAPPASLDVTTAWQLVDRLFYSSMPSLGDFYACPSHVSNGCNGDGLYANFMAADDDGDGTANGTPHAAAIFAALDRHGIACGAASDPANQNQTSCPALTAPSLTGVGGNNRAELSWSAVAGATRYLVFRNEAGCDAGYTRVAEVTAPTTTYTDTTVVNGIEYFYRVQAVTASDSCAGPMSSCETVLPVPCETPAAPASLVAAADGDNRIVLGWSSADPVADTFRVYRAIGTCPQPSYDLVASGLTGTSWADDPVSGDVTFAYVVAAVDETAGCESIVSNCSEAQTTGACTLAPTFAGLGAVTNPGSQTCGLELDWSGATAECGGAVSYNVYRSTSSGFTPGAATLVAGGVTATSYLDDVGLEYGTPYHYVVRAVDGANASEDDNLVELEGVPTGPTAVALSDDFESGNQGWVFADGSPAASTGDFVIGDPVGTTGNDGDASQPEDDHTPGAGVSCLYTATNPNGEAGVNDVDGGEVMATSPSFDGGAYEVLQLELWRWFFNEDADDSGDHFVLEVSNDDGASWTTLETIPDSDTTTNSWTRVQFDLADVLPLTATMKIRVRAADGPANGDLVEAAVDDIVITGWSSCDTSGQTSAIFSDDFEGGDTAAWSGVAP